MSAGNKTSKRTILAAERRVRAMELRREGKSYSKIGTELGCTAQRAHKIVTEELQKVRDKLTEETSEVKTLELQRLDDLFVVAHTEAEAGNLPAIDRCLRIMERRSRLLGLDMPEKMEHIGTVVQDIPPTPEVLVAQNNLLKAVANAKAKPDPEN